MISDGGFQVFKNLHVYLSRYFKPKMTATLLCENSLFDSVSS